MIYEAIIWKDNSVIVRSGPLLKDVIDTDSVNLILSDLCQREVSKVIQTNKFRLGIECRETNIGVVGFALVAEKTEATALQTACKQIASTLESKLDQNLPIIQSLLMKKLLEINEELKKRNDALSRIENNLNEATTISQVSLKKMMERGEDLIQIEDSTKNLSMSAEMFESEGRRLRRQVEWQRKKTLIIMGLVAFLTFYLFFRIVS